MAKEFKKEAKNRTDELTEKSIKARRKLANYLKENKLDPEKDWTKHKKHGPIISKWLKTINIGEEAADKALKKKSKKKPDMHPKKKTVTKAPTSYEYPEVDGQPMSPDMKKKFRAKMRTLSKGNFSPKEAQKKALDFVKDGPAPKSSKIGAKDTVKDSPKKKSKNSSSESETPKKDKSGKKDKASKGGTKSLVKSKDGKKKKKVVKDED